MGIFDDIGKAFESIGEEIVEFAEGIGEGVATGGQRVEDTAEEVVATSVEQVTTALNDVAITLSTTAERLINQANQELKKFGNDLERAMSNTPFKLLMGNVTRQIVEDNQDVIAQLVRMSEGVAASPEVVSQLNAFKNGFMRGVTDLRDQAIAVRTSSEQAQQTTDFNANWEKYMLTGQLNKAFAIAPGGRFGWRTGVASAEGARAAALQLCNHPNARVISTNSSPLGLDLNGQNHWNRYIHKKRDNRAFAISSGGRFGWRTGQATVEEAKAEAIRNSGDPNAKVVSINGSPNGLTEEGQLNWVRYLLKKRTHRAYVMLPNGTFGWRTSQATPEAAIAGARGYTGSTNAYVMSVDGCMPFQIMQ